MAKTKPESLIVKAIIHFTESVNGKAIKIHGSAFTELGTPDILGAISGLHFFVETKLPGEDATPIQKQRLQEWADQGYITGVVHSLDEFKELIGWTAQHYGYELSDEFYATTR